ncbi:MAG TPA: flagellar biosynthesis anti-sigma factor FlgM [Clostridiales bacterium]|nr:flagellar biosynthesis anti-sigma factor FlgM [Clostridiales bacterium]
MAEVTCYEKTEMKINPAEIFTKINTQKLSDYSDKQQPNPITQEQKTSPNIDKVEISHIPQNNESTDLKKIPAEIEMAKQEIINSIKKHPDIEKYQQIKDQVQSGNYTVDAKETAMAMIHKGSFDELV